MPTRTGIRISALQEDLDELTRVDISSDSTTATISTEGTKNLILNTNEGTNSGTITIEDGTSGDVKLATQNEVHLTGGSVGIGTTSPGSHPDEKNDLVIGDSSGHHGMTVASGAGSIGTLRFAHSTTANNGEGWIDYHNTSKNMRFGTDGLNTRMTIDSSGNVTVTGDIVLDDGGSLKEAGGTSAITFDGSGHITKLGQDSPSSDDVLTYDGSKWVASAAGGGAVSAVANGSDNRIATFSSSTALNGETNLSFDGSVLTVAGEVSVGSGSARGVIESNGDQDLLLQTGNSATGTIAITDGANGAITLTPNGQGAAVVVLGHTNGALQVKGAEGGVARLSLSADEGDDNGDTWNAESTADGKLTFSNNASGSYVNALELENDAVGVSHFFHHEKGIQGAYTALTTDTDLDDDHFIVQASRGAVLTLPAVSADNAGRWYFITRVDDGTSNGAIDIDANASETIEGNLEYHLESDGDGVALYDNGSKWIVMWEKKAPTRAGFAPTDVENCVIWLSGGVGITTDGSGDVTQWADQSGNSNHAIQSGSQAMPSTATVESTTVPAFSTSDILKMTTNVLIDDDEPWTIFLAANASGNFPANTHLFGTGSAANGHLYAGDTDGGTTGFGKGLFVDDDHRSGVKLLNADAGLQARNGAHTLNGTEVIVAHYNGSSSLKLDGGARTWTCSNTGQPADHDYTQLTLCASSGDGVVAAQDGFAGNICEVIVYQRDLDHSEMRLVRDYLLSRWT